MVKSDDPTTLIRIVLRGARSVATQAQPTAPGMPSYGRQLDDAQIATVLTYMRNGCGARRSGRRGASSIRYGTATGLSGRSLAARTNSIASLT
ncbi:mono/diheme cytochrome c family protein [Bradyrhizobium sp. USDA 10063]